MSGHVFGNERRIGRNVTFFQRAAQQNNYKGSFGELSFAWETCELRIHDGCKCGGKGLADNAGLTAEEVKAIAQQCVDAYAETDIDVKVESVSDIVDGSITITMSDGTVFTVKVESDELDFDPTGSPTFDNDAMEIRFKTRRDATGTVGADRVIDLSELYAALTSPAAPSFVGNAVSFDPVTSTYTITDTDTNTDTTIPDTFFRTKLTTNADGSITVQECDTNGNPVGDPTIIPAPSTPPETNLLENIECVDGSVTVTKEDGSDICFNSTLNSANGIANGSVTINDTTPVGPLTGKMICYSATMPKCGGRIKTETHSGYLPQPDTDFPQGNTLQTVQMSERISYNGGATYTGFNNTGGVDAVGLGVGGDTEYPQGSEYSFYASTMSPLLFGTVDICVIQNVNVNNISAGAGQVNSGAFNSQSYWTEMECC